MWPEQVGISPFYCFSIASIEYEDLIDPSVSIPVIVFEIHLVNRCLTSLGYELTSIDI